jgi:hypothetical protein
MKAEASKSADGTRVKVVSSDYGRVIAAAKARLSISLTSRTRSRPSGYGACARAWPLVLTKGKPWRPLASGQAERDGDLLSDCPGTRFRGFSLRCNSHRVVQAAYPAAGDSGVDLTS